MEYDIVSYNQATAHFEISVNVDGFNYMVIYGSHFGGGFCAIPNHGIACEMGFPEDTFYNKESLMHHGLSPKTARSLACAIRDASNKG